MRPPGTGDVGRLGVVSSGELYFPGIACWRLHLPRSLPLPLAEAIQTGIAYRPICATWKMVRATSADCGDRAGVTGPGVQERVARLIQPGGAPCR
jgi:hypothetical protein